MADRRAAESTLTKSLRDLDYGYSDLCRYVSYSKNKQSEAVSLRSSPRSCAHAHKTLFSLAPCSLPPSTITPRP